MHRKSNIHDIPEEEFLLQMSEKVHASSGGNVVNSWTLRPRNTFWFENNIKYKTFSRRIWKTFGHLTFRDSTIYSMLQNELKYHENRIEHISRRIAN